MTMENKQFIHIEFLDTGEIDIQINILEQETAIAVLQYIIAGIQDESVLDDYSEEMPPDFKD